MLFCIYTLYTIHYQLSCLQLAVLAELQPRECVLVMERIICVRECVCYQTLSKLASKTGVYHASSQAIWSIAMDSGAAIGLWICVYLSIACQKLEVKLT